MYRDPGPSYNLGFGINSRRDLPQRPEHEGADPNGSFVAKSLQDHPFLKFAAASAATMVGMHVASGMIRKGGLKLMAKGIASETPAIAGRFAALNTEMRSIGRTLDDWEGVFRSDTGVRIPLDQYRTPKEVGDLKRGIMSDADWGFRENIQQKLVSQARRLPYELPAAYMSQRLPGIGTDAIFGYGNEEDKPNWYNPADVLGDFAQQSVKNLAGFLLPVEAGGTVLKGGMRRLLTGADGVASPAAQSLGVNLNASLKLLGHSSSDILQKMVRFSGKSTAAFGSGINEAVQKNRGVVDILNEWRHGAKQAGTKRWLVDQLDKRPIDNELFDVVQPLGTARNFSKGFKNVWSPIVHGEVNQNSFDFRMANQDAVRGGLSQFMFKHGKTFDVDVGLAKRTGRLNSKFEQIGSILKQQQGGKDQLFPDAKDMRGTPFYDRIINDAYQDRLVQRLSQEKDLDADAVKRVVELLKVRNRPTGSVLKPLPLSDRFQFGDVKQAGGAEYPLLMGQAMEKAVPGHGKKIVDRLFGQAGLLSGVDAKFVQDLPQLESGVQDVWRTSMRDIVLPDARAMLGRSTTAFESLDDLNSQEVRDYLIRNTADRINAMAVSQGASKGEVIPLMHKSGKMKMQRDTKAIANDLRAYGFDASNKRGTAGYEEMKSFLTHQGTVAKKGSKDAFNAFGLRKMSVEDALTKGYFDEGLAPTLRKLNAEMNGSTNPLGGASFARTPLGGVWETKGGKTIDLSPFRNSFKKAMDSFGENFQIPLLHLNPLNVAGGDAQRTMAETPILQFQSGKSRQPFTGAAHSDTDLWVFSRIKGGSKGKLSRVFNKFESETMQGSYRAMPDDEYSMLGRHVRLAVGEKGQLPDKERKGWRKSFSVDEDQQDSLIRRVSRMKGGRSWTEIAKGTPSRDLRNPTVMARYLADTTPEGKAALKALIKSDPDGVTQGFEALQGSLRVNGIRDRVANKLLEMPGVEGTPLERVLKPNGRRLTDIHTTEDFLSEVESRNAAVYASSTQGQLDQRKFSTKMLLKKDAEAAASQDRHIDRKSSSQALRKKGKFRRIEEIRANLLTHGLIDEGIAAGGFESMSSDLFAKLETLRNSGQISKAEYTEARVAVFSTQMSFDSVRQFQVGKAKQDRIRDALDSAMKMSDSKMHSVLQDIADSSIEANPMKRAWQKRLGAAPYEYSGTSYNPLSGNQEGNVFVPTFGTTLARNPKEAISSVFGFNTWSNPDAFSGSSIPMSHGVQRLNGFLSAVGAGLDETDFKGPLDFYARGMVGKRMLPLVAGGATVLAVDRTLGGAVHDKDQNGDRNYSPLILGGVATVAKEAEVLSAGIPGGQSMTEKRKELEEGEVAIRKGRWWPMGSTPWKGGRIDYYRPSWYRRLKAGATYTDETNGTPLEKLAYGYDFSPLRPLDPYHFEEKTKNTRPYPVTGDYFSGPWGPLTGVLNSTIGRVLKPSKQFHKKEVDWKLSQYQQVGASGVAAPPSDLNATNAMDVSGGGVALATGTPARSGGNTSRFSTASGVGSGKGAIFGDSSGGLSSGSGVGIATIGHVNADITQSAYGGTNSEYGTTITQGGFDPKIIHGGKPLNPNKLSYQASTVGYNAQEMLGIYGFAFGAARSSLGLGNQDMSPNRPVLANASKAFGSTRGFWDLGLGGLGDAPTPFEGDNANVEFSEFFRRFLTRERSDINYVNPIANDMGRLYPWMPGGEYFQNFKEGDPYAAIKTGEERLPGKGYEKLHGLHSDMGGRYGTLDQYKILGDIAPYSQQYRQLDKMVDKSITSEADQELVDTVRNQVAQKAKKFDFSPYEYKGTAPTTRRATITAQMSPGLFQVSDSQAPIQLAGVTPRRDSKSMKVMSDLIGKEVSITTDSNRPDLNIMGESTQAMVKVGNTNVNKQLLDMGGYQTDTGQGLVNGDMGGLDRKMHEMWEGISHKDTPINTKFLPEHTATEDWERHNVYGATFPEWSHPIKNFLKPSVYKATNRGPILGALSLGGIGSMFGSTARGKVLGTLLGSATGFGAGTMRNAQEVDTGKRFIPKDRKKELGVEENADILNYVKFMKLKNEAEMSGDDAGAAGFLKQAQSTMYGADLQDVNSMTAAMPDRKRPYFKEMLNAPVKDRNRILSTAGRLERRMYESAWGMNVEKRPDLDTYFSQHELPGSDWAGWQPDVDMENVKIKVAQSTGLDVSQMGYYPQQIASANAVNIDYPDFNQHSSKKASQQMLQAYLSKNGINGHVLAVPNGTNSNHLAISAGVRS